MRTRPSYRRIAKPSSWRRLAIATWRAPNDPTIFGAIDVDVTQALELIETVRRTTGVQVTLTHLVIKAVALAIAENPDGNGLVIGKRAYTRDDIDIFCQVSSENDRELSGMKIRQADRRSVVDIAEEVLRRAERVRAREDSEVESTKAAMDRIPSWLLGPVLRLTDFLSYRLGLDLSRLGVAHDPFGSAMVSSIGGIEAGLDSAFAPLFPISHVPIVVLVHNVQRRAVVVGDRIEIRPIVSLCFTIDHRFIDGILSAKLAATLNDRLTHALEHLAPEEKELTAARDRAPS
ncbi:MAG: 2-oxo acid dehydrogenase subunit E2 [Proteobacteria bacterium]|nr:2-oxo acid dehydrogenase subunit E2 [Pseudomonadota bacterium]